jgi:hypothetical protein
MNLQKETVKERKINNKTAYEAQGVLLLSTRDGHNLSVMIES